MANWFTSMNVRERRTFWACFTGWALDAMDVQLYAVVMPTLIALWGMSQAQAGTLGTAALLFSSFGGWLAGILADRFGRADRPSATPFVWFALFTFLSGFTQSYEQLLFTRSMQGLGFGGEWAAGAVLMSEVIDKRDPGPRRRHRPGRLVGRLRHCGAPVHDRLQRGAAGDGVAVSVLPRVVSGVVRALDSPLRGRAGSLPANAARRPTGALSSSRSSAPRFDDGRSWRRCSRRVVSAATT